MQQGNIFDIQRFCTHDGPGIRTVIFMKGCPLRCKWCHNPESMHSSNEIFYNSIACIGCGNCIDVCDKNAHNITGKTHIYNRDSCELCLQCAQRCNTGALEIAGRTISIDDAMREINKDLIFYNESGGGITLSGGEPTVQIDFAYELLKQSKEAGINTCVETCGFAPQDKISKILPYTDLFLWDIKDTDETRHKANTGVSLKPIISNLKMADELGIQTILRCILIAGVNLNNEHLDKLAELYNSLSNCKGIELIPYHTYGESKYTKLGIDHSSGIMSAPSNIDMKSANDYMLEKWQIRTINGTKHDE